MKLARSLVRQLLDLWPCVPKRFHLTLHEEKLVQHNHPLENKVMKLMLRQTLTLLLAFTFYSPGALAEDTAVEAMQEYLMFQDYTSGIILPQQIDQTVFNGALFVDTRDASQFAAETIPGALNIEWREVLERIDEIPESRMTILFCNTGTLSAQATFALRVAGKSNVVVMQSGLNGWKHAAPYKPTP
ncbi:MAG: rhodanese-like domain-containing protein [Opitutae bacterium]